MVYLWNLAKETDNLFSLSFAEAKVCPTAEHSEAIDTETPVDELLWFRDGKHLLVAGRLVVLWDVPERKAL